METEMISFSCQREELTIRGKVFRPKGGESHPAVIISHGFMANQETVAGYAQALAGEGYAAFTFDFCGGCVKGSSDGANRDMTVLTEVEDLKAVMDYVLARDYVAGEKLILMGCSQGGFVSAVTAAQRPAQVDRLVLFFPALCIPDDARSGRMMFFRFDPQNIPDLLGSRPMELGGDYARTMIDKNPYEMIMPYPGPVLIIHGTSDKIAGVRYSERAQECYGYDRCTLIKLEGQGHGFKKEADQRAVAFLREFLRGRVELFAVDVTLTGHSIERKGRITEHTLPFTGTADGPEFHGVIDPGAADVQQWRGRKARHCLADYTLTGVDRTGVPCRIHIVNEDKGDGWSPTVTTDSTILSYINSEPCTEYFEPRRKGPVIHIFNRPPEKA